jgi:acyl-ACP thioesterase
VQLRTFCSALGPRWAERTTTLAVPGGEKIQTVAVWVAISRDTGRPMPLIPEFYEVYGEATRGRRVSARLSHPGPPADAGGRPWPLRSADFDIAGHVNNAVHWAAVEDVIAAGDRLPSHAEIEYHRPILPGQDPCLATAATCDSVDLWLLDDTRSMASARLR